jgi:hypothetical protein
VGRGRGGREVEERVVGGEVMPVVDAGYVVEVGVLDEGEVVSRRMRSADFGKEERRGRLLGVH